MEWLIGESRATPNIITRYKMSRDYANYKTKAKAKSKKKNLILNIY